MSLYLWLNVLTIFFPLIASFDQRIGYLRKFPALLLSILLSASFFIPWDIAFTVAGVWGFTSVHLLGVNLWHLPIEEWLFFLCIPFSTVFIYECVCYFVKRPFISHQVAQRCCIAMGIGLWVVASTQTDARYTFYTSIFCGTWLVMEGIWRRGRYLPHFFVAYLWHLVPFLLVNGALTGAFSQQPVVWYNNEENLSMRCLTIPIEDFAYSLLLFLMTVNFYEIFKEWLPLQKKSHLGVNA